MESIRLESKSCRPVIKEEKPISESNSNSSEEIKNEEIDSICISPKNQSSPPKKTFDTHALDVLDKGKKMKRAETDAPVNKASSSVGLIYRPESNTSKKKSNFLMRPKMGTLEALPDYDSPDNKRVIKKKSYESFKLIPYEGNIENSEKLVLSTLDKFKIFEGMSNKRMYAFFSNKGSLYLAKWSIAAKILKIDTSSNKMIPVITFLL